MSHCVTLSVLLSLSVVLEGRKYSYTYTDTRDIKGMLVVLCHTVYCVTLSVFLSLSVVLEGREFSYTYTDTRDIKVMVVVLCHTVSH